jgi:hypothetical protein
MATASKSNLGQYALPAVGVVILIVAFVIFSQGGSTTQGTGVIQPDTQAEVAQINENGAVAQTNANAAIQYDTIIGNEFGALTSLASNEDQYNSAARIAGIQAGIQLQQSQVAAGVATTQLQDQEQAQQAQQSYNFWGQIIGDAFGAGSSIAKLFL